MGQAKCHLPNPWMDADNIAIMTVIVLALGAKLVGDGVGSLCS